jgi:hypothetical protein
MTDTIVTNLSARDSNLTTAQSLRLLADAIENLAAAHPDIAEHIYISASSWIPASQAVEEMGKIARFFAPCNKRFSDHYFEVSKWFGTIKIEFAVSRDAVCERKVVGTRTVEVPAREAYTRTEDVVEWECKPLLASDNEDA